MGIVGTPVIDRTIGQNGAIYFVATSYNPTMNGGTYLHKLHALDLTTGAELFGGPTVIQATYPGKAHYGDGSYVSFEAQKYYVRAALTELYNPITRISSIYFGFSSICDGHSQMNYGGWLMQYDASDLTQKPAVINFAPNDDIDPTETSPGYGGTIWASGTGFASDGSFLYVSLANGLWSGDLDDLGFAKDGDYGNSFVKVAPAPPPPQPQYMTVTDYFTMYDAETKNAQDVDLGSGGSIFLDMQKYPGVPPLAIAAGKDDNAYLCKRDDMGKWNPNNNNQIWQQLGLNGLSSPTTIYGAPAYFNGTIFYGPAAGTLEAYTFGADGKLPLLPTSQTTIRFPYPGTTPSVSSNGTTDGTAIVWAVEYDFVPAQSVLHAYKANDLTNELFHGVIAANPQNHFDTPVIANGKVFVSNLVKAGQPQPTGVQVFGLFGQ
jgi:hypothetical protein